MASVSSGYWYEIADEAAVRALISSKTEDARIRADDIVTLMETVRSILPTLPLMKLKGKGFPRQASCIDTEARLDCCKLSVCDRSLLNQYCACHYEQGELHELTQQQR